MEFNAESKTKNSIETGEQGFRAVFSQSSSGEPLLAVSRCGKSLVLEKQNVSSLSLRLETISVVFKTGGVECDDILKAICYLLISFNAFDLSCGLKGGL